MAEWFIPILTFIGVTSIGTAVVLARYGKKSALENRLGTLAAQTPDVNALDPSPGLHGVLHRVGRVVSHKGPSPTLRSTMAQAGYHSFLAAEIYLGAKIILFVVGLTVLSLPVMSLALPLSVRLLLILTAATGLSFIPNLIVSLRRRIRCEEIHRALPEAIDLLEICVTAGMGLDMAWNAVTDEIRRVSVVLADEMTLMNLEIHLGTSRAEALHAMARRTNADELSSLAGVLAQAQQFGTSVSDALRTFATSMREVRSQRAQEAAEKLAVKLLLPMIVFIFPTVLIVTMGPAVIKLVTLLGGQ